MRTQGITPLSNWLAFEHNRIFVEVMSSIVEGRSIYVGMRFDTEDYWYDILTENDNEVDILEVFEPNVKYLRSVSDWSVIHGDITTYDLSKYKNLFWIQGPEHVSKDKLDIILPIISKMEHYFMSVPDVQHEHAHQDTKYNNEHEKHLSILSKEYYLQYFPEENIILTDNLIIIRK